MPEITRFYGIIIRMYFIGSEHQPPHFHAIYGENVGEFSIKDLQMIDGYLPNKAQNLVMEWARMHQTELLEIWNEQKFRKLEPLE